MKINRIISDSAVHSITNQKSYYPGIDGLRALAVLAVMIYHFNFIPSWKGGFLGVDIFFVISGYVIAKSLAGKESIDFFTFLSGFYKRRILRIVPALCVCLFVTFLAYTLFIPDSWLNEIISKTGFSAFFGISNFSLVKYNGAYFAPKAEFNPFLHTWSLAVEEQFYLIFPLFYYWQSRRGRSLKGQQWIFKAVFLFLIISSLVFSFWETSHNWQRAYYLLPSRFWELGAGVLLFMIHSRFIKKRISHRASVFLSVSGTFILLAAFILVDENSFPAPWALAPVIGTGLLILAIVLSSGEGNIFNRIMRSDAFVRVGKLSYSLYLWHWPVAVLFKWTCGLDTYFLKSLGFLISLLLALLSYQLIEKPVRSNSKLKEMKNSKIIGGGVVVLLLFILSAFLIDHFRGHISLSVTRNKYIWSSWRHWQDRQNQPFFEDPEINGRSLFILGDSHTAAYRTLINIVSTQLGLETYEFERGGCAVAGLLTPLKGNEEWNTFYKESLEEIKGKSQPGDIVFLASLRMPELSYRFELADIDQILIDHFSSESELKRREALKEADEIIYELESLGVHVLIDAPKPIIKVPLFRCSDWFNRQNPIADPGVSISRDLLLEIRKPVMDSLEILQNNHEKMHIWDPFPVMCPQENFYPYDDEGLPLFVDGDHLSAQGNRILVDSFREKIRFMLKSDRK